MPAAHDAVDWAPPAPRDGLAGAWDRFIGPGATPAEQWLQVAVPLGLTAALVVYWRQLPVGWSSLQYTVAAVLAFDVLGGIVTNATSSAKRWYHRPQAPPRQHLAFVAAHGIHLLAAAAVFDAYGARSMVAAYGVLLAAAVVIAVTPLYLRRPAGFGLYAATGLVSLHAFAPPPGMEWFLPLFYLKLLLGHMLAEAPFRPVVSDRRAAARHEPTRS
jgi:hypothetical protein